FLRGARIRALAAARGAEVVHDHARALARELERVLAADAAPRAGHDHHSAFTDPHRLHSSWLRPLCENRAVDWDDLRTFLAVARAGSLAEAARSLRGSHTALSHPP